MTALVIAEHDHGSLKGATLNTVTAAAACGGDVHVLIAGHNAGEAAKQAAQIAGVAKVLHADAPQLAEQLAENVAAQVLAIAGNYSHLLFPATAHGKNVAPRVAAKLDVAQISDITKVDAADTFERPIYAGNAIAIVQSLDTVKVITVRSTGFDAAPVILSEAKDLLANSETRCGQQDPSAAPQDDSSGGGATIEAVIVAINKDPEAPIFSIADYGLEADLFTAVPELAAALG
jgi:electron transfer flavoprotein alpha subunit